MNRINWIIHIFLNQEVVGKTDRTGDKTLNLQHFFAMSLGLSVENIYYIAIAVLACVLGAEIAGICMLIGKMRRARKGEENAVNDEYDNNAGANYAIAALSFGALSVTAELILLVLAIAAAVGALVLCILLAVFYSKGYLLISTKAAREAEDAEAKARAAKQAEQEAIAVSVAEEIYDEDDFFAEEAENDYEGDEAAQEAISNLIATEDAVLSEEYEEEPAQEEVAEETAIVAQEPAATVVQTVERTVITEGVPTYNGQAPIVEKHIIETTKEIIKETNTTTVTEGKGEQFSPATEEMMKAITEFMKLETQLRMEKEVAVERPAEQSESTPAFADAEDEEVEVDEVDTEDELDAEDEAEREADAEENDDEYESDLFGNERIVGFDEETGCYIIARYRKSCEAKLMQSRPATKKYYGAIRNALMGYEGTKERMSWTIDTYTNEHTQIAKINIRPRTLDLYLALDPSTLEDSVYRGRDVGGKKKYAETPFLYKVNSPRKLMLALELVQRACEEQGLSPIDIEEVNYEEQYPFTDTETLITRGLIREYLREEKPAATFELDPDHVPQLIEEDETVIPVNANFTWEFDNDQPEVQETVEEVVEEEPVVEESVVEEVVEEEPVAEEPTPAPGTTTTTTTTHETIRTTERHYTERYFAGGQEAEVSEETRTIEVLPEPASEQPIEVEAEEIAPTVEDEPIAEEIAEEAVEEIAEEPEETSEEETVEEVIEEEPEEEEIIDDEIEEEIEEDTTDEQIAQMQSAVAALFGDDVFEDDEPIEEPAPEVEETVEEEVIEEEAIEEEVIEEEVIEEEPVEEEPQPEEVIEEVYEEEIEAVSEEEPEEDEEILEEVYYEEVYEEVPEEETEEEYYEEVVYEEEPEETEEEYYEEVVYEEVPEEETEEEYYEEIVYEEVPEEEYYEEVVYEEVYEDVEGEELEEAYEEVYEEEVEEIEEEVEEEPAPAHAPQPVSDVVLLDVCVFDDYFDNGAIVNLETLKQVGLAPESATRLKVYASGTLKGQFTVEANHFTLDAIKAIGDADGDSIMIR